MSTGWARLATAGSLAIGIAACTDTAGRSTDRASTATPGTTTTGTTGQLVTVAQLAADPAAHEGQRVTVRANVGVPVGQSAFTLMDASGSGSDTRATPSSGSAGTTGAATSPDTQHALLVVSPAGVPSDRQDLTISGTLRRFTSASSLRRDAPWLASGSTSGLAPYHNRPVIVADAIRTADGRDLLAAGSALPAGSGELGGGSVSDRP